ncbi:MAG: PilZ domain-containing protein [Gammaproteobacteria bacterium]|nr:PilZ domain-containing protein [Gammaproteobacteria bacterium]
MSQEFRRTRRRKVHEPIPVTDAMTGQVIGKIGNLSESGMLLLASQPLANDALYQFRFPLEPGEGAGEPLEIGAHLLWSDDASAPGQHWIGFRFIGQSDAQLRRLRAWVNAPGSQYA